MATPITKVSGVGAQTAEILIENGFESAEVLAAAKEEDLLKISGFGPSKAKKFIEAAQALVGTDAAAEAPFSEQSAKVETTSEVESETVHEPDTEVEKAETKATTSSELKVCTQKFSQKAKKKKDKCSRAKKKKKKSSRKKKSQ